jgi:hypothetical protein
MKKLMLFAGLYCLQPMAHASTLPAPDKIAKAPLNANDRALAHFRANFAEVQNPIWFSTNDKDLICSFHQGQRMNRVFYDSRGYWKYTLVSYPPSIMKQDLKDLVNENFKDFHIAYVSEIQSDRDEPVYIINLENEGFIKIIKVYDQEIEIRQTLEKQSDQFK